MSNEDYPGGYVLKASQNSKSCRCSGWPSRKFKYKFKLKFKLARQR